LARLLVFDLDGTLVDSSRDIAAAANAALARVAPGAAPIPLDAVLSFVGEGARLLVERCLAHVGSGLTADEVLPVYLECYASRLLDTTYLYPGIPEALEALASPTLAVLTNKPGDMSRAILDGLGVGPRFARVWGPGDGHRRGRRPRRRRAHGRGHLGLPPGCAPRGPARPALRPPRRARRSRHRLTQRRRSAAPALCYASPVPPR
jgi:phosphoglycolate phosphatase-like HAD superfamily hydrolase